ncbi:hypothetical protein SS50377_25461 [Spironucleus salmonicida]|uniref:Uncharacterized protein n=1 Tax=Spironucleus salmonicida TaxID=348837 RepID=V6LW14_9EUKA|nr:hypothetical protein SS50377_25461 [Spironucleus salmonicida]|eukprot:EST45009.1 Hypothetical protein SS50377_15028 [Spironucleus salmonicida]
MNSFQLEQEQPYFAEFDTYKAYSSNVLTPLQNLTITYNKVQVYVTSATQRIGETKLIQKQNQPCLTFTSNFTISPKTSPYLSDLSSFFNVQFKTQATTTEGLNYTAYFPIKATQVHVNFMFLNENIQIFQSSCNISRPFKFNINLELPGKLIWIMKQSLDSKPLSFNGAEFTVPQVKQVALNQLKKHFQQPFEETQLDINIMQNAQQLQNYKGTVNLFVFVTKCEINDYKLSLKFGISTTSSEYIGISFEKLDQDQVYGEKSLLKRLMIKGCQTWELVDLPKILYLYKFQPFAVIQHSIELNIADGKIQFDAFGQQFYINGMNLLDEKQKVEKEIQESAVIQLQKEKELMQKQKDKLDYDKLQEEKLKQEIKKQEISQQKKQKQFELLKLNEEEKNLLKQEELNKQQLIQQTKDQDAQNLKNKLEQERDKIKEKQKLIVQQEIARQKKLREDAARKQLIENTSISQQQAEGKDSKNKKKETGKLVFIKEPKPLEQTKIQQIQVDHIKQEPKQEPSKPQVDQELINQQQQYVKDQKAIQSDERLRKFQEARETDQITLEQLRKLVIQKEEELSTKKVNLIDKIKNNNEKSLLKITIDETQKKALSDSDIETIVEKELEKDVQHLHALKIKLKAKEYLTDQMQVQLASRLKEKEQLEEKRKMLDQKQKERLKYEQEQKIKQQMEEEEFVARYQQELLFRKNVKEKQLEDKKQQQIVKQKSDQIQQQIARAQAQELQEQEKLAKEKKRQEILQKIERQNLIKKEAQIQENIRRKAEMEELEKRKSERTQRLEEKKIHQQLLQNDLKEEQRRIKLIEIENDRIAKENEAKQKQLRYTTIREIKTDNRPLRTRKFNTVSNKSIQDDLNPEQNEIFEENLKQRREKLAKDFEKTQVKLQKSREQALQKIAQEEELKKLEREGIARLTREKYQLQRETEFLAEQELQQQNIEAEISRQQQIIEKQAFVQIKVEKWQKFWEVEEQKRLDQLEKSKVYSPTRDNAKLSCFMEMPKLVCVQLGEKGKSKRSQSSFGTSKWQ